jgi:hypothetical protein
MTKAVELAQQASTGVSEAFKNRIINGGMVLDQRNAGAVVNNSTATNTYVVDRFAMFGTEATKISGQQSTTAPTGFVNSWLITSLAATTATSAQAYGVRQIIEGNNIADLGWGSASAKAVTISFWVRSSITGTYALAFFNRDSPNRSYVANYTIDSANTFEYKTITIPGDTSGTWLTNNGQGIQVWWDLGSGSNFNETAGNWVGSLKVRTSGSSNWIGTNGATFYITGVQLEVGSSATSFDYRPYGTELSLCQRYFERMSGATNQAIGAGIASTTAQGQAYVKYSTTMRTAPTFSFSDLGFTDSIAYTGIVSGIASADAGTISARLGVTTNAVMTSTRAGNLVFTGTSGFLNLSAEL